MIGWLLVATFTVTLRVTPAVGPAPLTITARITRTPSYQQTEHCLLWASETSEGLSCHPIGPWDPATITQTIVLQTPGTYQLIARVAFTHTWIQSAPVTVEVR